MMHLYESNSLSLSLSPLTTSWLILSLTKLLASKHLRESSLGTLDRILVFCFGSTFILHSSVLLAAHYWSILVWERDEGGMGLIDVLRGTPNRFCVWLFLWILCAVALRIKPSEFGEGLMWNIVV
ncbi:hypothetical protein VNO78_28581 [Psophocarpus tetragonolobus]|uniref:Uncharacterized protein n=1 Tax=Psophocarpus tetragonolobus TaxID=3891 RepID=A0AAN9WY81_PSOTE